MFAGIILLIGLMFLATQLMIQGGTGAWPSITLASELGIPADRVFSDWLILEWPTRFVIADVQLWILLVLAAALAFWVMDWTDEMLRRIYGRPPPELPQEPELADSGKSV
jgi:hypothetical protein